LLRVLKIESQDSKSQTKQRVSSVNYLLRISSSASLLYRRYEYVFSNLGNI
jgi:hypothetical protein